MTTIEMGRVKASVSSPELRSALVNLNAKAERAALAAGLERSLLDLIKVRASQINKCAYCIGAHTKEARAHGETEQRLALLPAWAETSLYTEQERAALALTEAITVLTDGFVPDDVYQAAAEVFTEEQLVQVVWAATIINTFNRLGVSGRMQPTS
ncbi:carboxymuconolactone decarboxylase family protein [Labedaea rhizosphaerae]|uniref:AhpD family alkylhydroperoxidase n=1 Tax=Labedaea rhizosphaerae TaxID=598644 RepID=A0A4R6SMD2_LABRH|nr:carboxymuconolactone decarboxylase family protein [Labedaea rhizosphaerae]TDQ04482.1 AhpD family alkylhydroperoxidase [Labedaea rhizosphaerae]